MTTETWSAELAEQLDFLWTHQQRQRLRGLSDEEYFWEPVPGCWSVRPRGQGVAEEIGSAAMIIDFAVPAPDPPPVTTIAWRIGHLIVGVYGARNATYFDGPPCDYRTYAYAASADEALAALDRATAHWIAGVRGLSDDDLHERCREVGRETMSMAALVLHISREAIHHLAEVALLRDLHRGLDGSRLLPPPGRLGR